MGISNNISVFTQVNALDPNRPGNRMGPPVVIADETQVPNLGEPTVIPVALLLAIVFALGALTCWVNPYWHTPQVIAPALGPNAAAWLSEQCSQNGAPFKLTADRPDQSSAAQTRSEQDRSEQDRSVQSKAGQNSTGQSRTVQVRPDQDKPEQTRADQPSTGQCRSGHAARAGLGRAQ